MIDTPAAVVDLDRLEGNLERWQRYCEREGLRNRPHVKTHRCVEIARRQIELGAVGVTCQKLGEAEAMVDGGIDDVLIPYNLVGDAKLERLAALLGRGRVAVTVDDAKLLPGLAGAAAAAGAQLPVLVECDTGLGRAGVQTPEHAVELAKAVSRTRALRFEGFLTFPVLDGTGPFFAAAVAGATSSGLEARVVSAGGTPSMWRAAELAPLVSEYRVGNYILEAPSSRIVRLDEEHAYVAVADGDTLELGSRVRIVPNHACVVANLFDELWLDRDGQLEGSWRVAARGRSR